MNKPPQNAILDRGLLISLVVQHEKGTLDKTEIEALDFIADHYRRILYEHSGVSAIEEKLHRIAPICHRLVAISPRTKIEYDQGERGLLSNTLQTVATHPPMLHALQEYEKESGGLARQAEDVLGYVFRLLLLGRQLDADIIGWTPRNQVFLALFEEAAVQKVMKRVREGVTLFCSHACRFPYVPPQPAKGCTTRYRILLVNPTNQIDTTSTGRSSIEEADKKAGNRGLIKPVEADVFLRQQAVGMADGIMFHIFLSHNRKDKLVVRELKQLLATQNLKVWLDEDELRPGIPWLQQLESGIKSSASMAVIVGKDGLGPWEDEEMQGAIRLAVKDKRPIIPILLPGATSQPELPMFLGNRTWVDFRTGFTNEGIAKLVWGITGKKP